MTLRKLWIFPLQKQGMGRSNSFYQMTQHTRIQEQKHGSPTKKTEENFCFCQLKKTGHRGVQTSYTLKHHRKNGKY
jgi:hypothetical protein